MARSGEIYSNRFLDFALLRSALGVPSAEMTQTSPFIVYDRYNTIKTLKDKTDKAIYRRTGRTYDERR